jgi:hypothetical protein
MNHKIVSALSAYIVSLIIWGLAGVLHFSFGFTKLNAFLFAWGIFSIWILYITYDNFVLGPRRCEIILDILARNGEEMRLVEILEASNGRLKKSSLGTDLECLIRVGQVEKRIHVVDSFSPPTLYFRLKDQGRRKPRRKTKLSLNWDPQPNYQT